MPAFADRVDSFQREHPVAGFPLAVVYKYFDDQGPYLAATLTYYAFIAIFPLLLIASSLLGFLLQGNEELQAELLDSALSRFPIVGTQLGRPEGLQGSASAVVIGSLAALYGILGLGQAAQNALNAIWAVPRNSRLNPIVGRVRSLLLLGLAGVAVLLITVLSGLATNLASIGLSDDLWVQVLGAVVSVARHHGRARADDALHQQALAAAGIVARSALHRRPVAGAAVGSVRRTSAGSSVPRPR